MLGMILPQGLMGLLMAAMLAADMSTDSSYMLTWGSVIWNDILAPFRKTQWSEKRGLRWNRMIVALIGVFLLFYGLWYQVTGSLWDYLTITGTIYLASMSVLLVACCYWKRANSWGAAAAIIFGAAIPLAYLATKQIWQVPALDEAGKVILDVAGKVRMESPIERIVGSGNAGIAAFVIAAIAMVVGSYLKPRSKSQAA